MTIVITDAKYRMSIAALRSLAKASHSVIMTQTKFDAGKSIPAFTSKYVSRSVILDCDINDSEAYFEKLYELLSTLDNPVLFPIGAKTLSLVSERREEFSKVSRFAIPSKEALDFANDKSLVTELAQKIGISVPYTFGSPADVENFPIVIKPKCGEKYGLKASKRYAIAKNTTELEHNYSNMFNYGGYPVVQEYIGGVGVGVSLLMNNSGKAVSAICHKRIREYPYSGGPSTCCETFYDKDLVMQSEALLHEIGFVGFAMVEYKMTGNEISAKNARLLEINPRIWGSFPLTYIANSTFSEDYVNLSAGKVINHPLDNYKIGARMNFTLNDFAAVVELLKHGKLKRAMSGLSDIVTKRATDGIKSKDDPKPHKRYMKLKLLKH